MPEDKDRLCAFIMEEEAPERILAMFSKEEAERRAWNRKYRFFLLELSMDKLDTANPDFQYIKRAVNENCDYILSRCNVANGPSERILQDLEMTQDNVTQTVINSSAPQKKGWMSFFSKGG
ncbi:hypothetical protein [Methanocella sp. MCL-LM]|uniref:hypothetical protein n=1 Tax=Methanocella sp. MCL-LM TaxID=3412035 RepID=UPI003C7631BF